jgi:hypothetical protein
VARHRVIVEGFRVRVVMDDADAPSPDSVQASEAGRDGEEGGDGASGAPPFDPGAYSVAQLRSVLLEYDLTDDQIAALASAERAGRGRASAIDAIERRGLERGSPPSEG